MAWQATMTRTCATLGQRLLAPVLSHLPDGVERLLLLPSAELFLFPLHAIPLTEYSSELLCERYQMSYIPSLRVFIDTQARVKQTPVPDLYALINPQNNLLFAPAERFTIAQYFLKQTIDEGKAGTKKQVQTRAPGHSYLHFACHGKYDWSDPPASGLALANNEHLTLQDLQRGEFDLSAVRLVTLSACETGIIDVVQGSPEEYVGLPAGFLAAGIPCVVSSLWTVPDISTALLMERLYRNHLTKGMNLPAALGEAQIWVRGLRNKEIAQCFEQWWRHAHGNIQTELFKYMRYYQAQAAQEPSVQPFAHPYYWAAFTCTGM